MTYDIFNLNDILDDVERFGGKAVILSKLIKTGLQIPAGFVISSSVFQLYIKEELEEKEFYIVLSHWLSNFNMKNEFIVRSSASIENIKGIDCPGIFDSFVCSNKNDILETVKKVWDSVNSFVAKSFLSRMQINSNNVKMAVIIQEIKRGKYSAVIQSYDLIENRNRIIVEYCRGELNSIVDDCKDAALCFIEYDNDLTDTENNQIPIKQIRKDCKLIESVVEGKSEIEAQICDETIWYIQARSIE